MLAERLVEILDAELESGGMHADQLQLRSFLCRALGMFRSPSVLPVLIRAAETERESVEIDVRRSALEALAAWWAEQEEPKPTPDTKLVRVVLDATKASKSAGTSENARSDLRSTATFALGVLGGADAELRLIDLLSDSDMDVRFNAATGLARHGRIEAEPVLLEMLQSSRSSTGLATLSPSTEKWKLQIVHRNALRCIEALAERDGRINSPSVKIAVAELAAASEDVLIQDQAKRTLQALEAVTSP
jgi:HEAT repeat protein